MEDLIRLAVGGNPSCHRRLDHFAMTAEQADHSVCFCYGIRGFVMFPYYIPFGFLPGAGVVARPDATLYKCYDPLFRSSPQQSERFESDAVCTSGFPSRL